MISSQRWDKKSFCGGKARSLYCILTREGDQYVKFGISKNAEKRFISIQSACPIDLELYAVIDHTIGLEARIHAHLEAYNKRGEWYVGCDEILRAAEIMKGGDAKLFEDYAEHLYWLKINAA